MIDLFSWEGETRKTRRNNKENLPYTVYHHGLLWIQEGYAFADELHKFKQKTKTNKNGTNRRKLAIATGKNFLETNCQMGL